MFRLPVHTGGRKFSSSGFSRTYPFTALVGQERMREALILAGVHSRLGGVLIRGQRGTGKSTAVRALADLLPEIEVVTDCVYQCHPCQPGQMCDHCLARRQKGETLPTSRRPVQVVELPLSATEDRIVGGLDFEHALREGERRIEPGVLAEANRGVVYVDEVNLLDERLTHLLLDVLATGVNRIEREGVSFSHPAEFFLVGTMNPEEGELGPQLLDRFGLCVEVEGLSDLQERLEIVRRWGKFEEDPSSFGREWGFLQEQMRRGIQEAQGLLRATDVPPELLGAIVEICLAHGVAGHRADILMREAARAIAACQGRVEVTSEDVARAADFVLPHRSRRDPTLQDSPTLPQRNNGQRKDEQEQPGEAQAQAPSASPGSLDDDGKKEEAEGEGAGSAVNPAAAEGSRPVPPQAHTQGDEPRAPNGHPSAEKEPTPLLGSCFEVGDPFKVRPLRIERDKLLRRAGGRRSPTYTLRKSGRYVRSTSVRRNNDLALDATIRAAAPHQVRRERDGLAIRIVSEDVREKVRERRMGSLLLFVVDASGSMGNALMTETKGAVLSLLLDAYEKRDKVGLVAFRETSAEVLLPPTNSTELAHKLLEDLPTGGKTPLIHGLVTGYQTIRNHLRRDRTASPLMILISDYRPNVALHESPYADYLFDERAYPRLIKEIYDMADYIQGDPQVRSLIIDVNETQDHLSHGRGLAARLGAPYFRIQDLKAGGIIQLVRRVRKDQPRPPASGQ